MSWKKFYSRLNYYSMSVFGVQGSSSNARLPFLFRVCDLPRKKKNITPFTSRFINQIRSISCPLCAICMYVYIVQVLFHGHSGGPYS